MYFETYVKVIRTEALGHHPLADIVTHEVTPRKLSLVHGITPCTNDAACCVVKSTVKSVR